MLLADTKAFPSVSYRYAQVLPQDAELISSLEHYAQLLELVSLEQLEAIDTCVYAPNKWTVADILQHIIDTERIFAYRALRIARNDLTELLGFDENLYAQTANTSARSIKELWDEFCLLRQSTLLLFKSFERHALLRTGICSQLEFSVAAIGFVLAGHPLHHFKVIQERYLPLV